MTINEIGYTHLLPTIVHQNGILAKPQVHNKKSEDLGGEHIPFSSTWAEQGVVSKVNPADLATLLISNRRPILSERETQRCRHPSP